MQPFSLRPLSNIFNTDADLGVDRISAEELRLRIRRDLLLVEGLQVPGTSLLCNPSTSAMVGLEPGFLDDLLGGGLILPVLPDDVATFQGLFSQLAASNSRSLQFQSLKTTERVAILLDRFVPTIKHAHRKSLDETKTSLSIAYLNNLGVLIPACRMHLRTIDELFRTELDKFENVPGSFWAQLPDRVTELEPLRPMLREIGSIIFDLSYQDTRDAELVGHTYGLPLCETTNLIVGVEARSDIVIPQVQPQMSRIEPVDWDAIARLSISELLTLRRETQSERRAYLKALTSILPEKQETWVEAHYRLDDYLASLSRVSTALRPMGTEVGLLAKEARATATMLQVFNVAEGLTVGAIAIFGLQHRDPMAAVYCAVVALGARRALERRRTAARDKLQILRQKLESVRTATLRVRPPREEFARRGDL